jgi:hypothetical protein
LSAGLATPGTPATDWSYSWDLPSPGQYGVYSRAVDSVGKQVESPFTTFMVVDSSADSEPPDVTIVTPGPGELVPVGLVTVNGTATDNLAIESVEVAVRSNTTGQWLHSDGTWGPFRWNAALLDNPGTTMSAWSWSFDAADSGSYGLLAIATDLAGNVDPTRPWVTFSATSGEGDTVPPNAVVAAPLRNQSLPIGIIDVAGSATDDMGVAEVSIAVRNNDSGAWLRPDGTWGSFAWNAALLDNPDALATDWTWSFTAPEPGSYGLQVRARDTSGNPDPTKPWIPFTVS